MTLYSLATQKICAVILLIGIVLTSDSCKRRANSSLSASTGDELSKALNCDLSMSTETMHLYFTNYQQYRATHGIAANADDKKSHPFQCLVIMATKIGQKIDPKLGFPDLQEYEIWTMAQNELAETMAQASVPVLITGEKAEEFKMEQLLRLEHESAKSFNPAFKYCFNEDSCEILLRQQSGFISIASGMDQIYSRDNLGKEPALSLLKQRFQDIKKNIFALPESTRKRILEYVMDSYLGQLDYFQLVQTDTYRRPRFRLSAQNPQTGGYVDNGEIAQLGKRLTDLVQYAEEDFLAKDNPTIISPRTKSDLNTDFIILPMLDPDSLGSKLMDAAINQQMMAGMAAAFECKDPKKCATIFIKPNGSVSPDSDPNPIKQPEDRSYGEFIQIRIDHLANLIHSTHITNMASLLYLDRIRSDSNDVRPWLEKILTMSDQWTNWYANIRAGYAAKTLTYDKVTRPSNLMHLPPNLAFAILGHFQTPELSLPFRHEYRDTLKRLASKFIVFNVLGQGDEKSRAEAFETAKSYEYAVFQQDYNLNKLMEQLAAGIAAKQSSAAGVLSEEDLSRMIHLEKQMSLTFKNDFDSLMGFISQAVERLDQNFQSLAQASDEQKKASEGKNEDKAKDKANFFQQKTADFLAEKAYLQCALYGAGIRKSLFFETDQDTLDSKKCWSGLINTLGVVGDNGAHVLNKLTSIAGFHMFEQFNRTDVLRDDSTLSSGQAVSDAGLSGKIPFENICGFPAASSGILMQRPEPLSLSYVRQNVAKLASRAVITRECMETTETIKSESVATLSGLILMPFAGGYGPIVMNRIGAYIAAGRIGALGASTAGRIGPIITSRIGSISFGESVVARWAGRQVKDVILIGAGSASSAVMFQGVGHAMGVAQMLAMTGGDPSKSTPENIWKMIYGDEKQTFAQFVRQYAESIAYQTLMFGFMHPINKLSHGATIKVLDRMPRQLGNYVVPKAIRIGTAKGVPFLTTTAYFTFAHNLKPAVEWVTDRMLGEMERTPEPDKHWLENVGHSLAMTWGFSAYHKYWEKREVYSSLLAEAEARRNLRIAPWHREFPMLFRIKEFLPNGAPVTEVNPQAAGAASGRLQAALMDVYKLLDIRMVPPKQRTGVQLGGNEWRALVDAKAKIFSEKIDKALERCSREGDLHGSVVYTRIKESVLDGAIVIKDPTMRRRYDEVLYNEKIHSDIYATQFLP